ncbi:hypothetical protein HNR12_002188 [Streptomonospora nanhaiensis]|uniref:Uncharacterized protein n=1 Tax=Streptomonospora nanhaiensis TaxID=1323731 RepID=A0A853BN10_9ACTN|nr:hypothetical protein [Streptomonospora nanhaiensis]NYI95911.1 hypothetical protein [Streptomonospora nanhaiensis]
MTTLEMIRDAGFAAVALLLLAAITVLVLRLVALPLAGASLALDAAATGIVRAVTAPPGGGP